MKLRYRTVGSPRQFKMNIRPAVGSIFAGKLWGVMIALMLSMLLPTILPVVAQSQSSADMFADIAKVLMHPRCLNCHPRDDRPRQGNTDATRLHQMNVQRGADNKGAAAQKCSACHQESNNRASNSPGAPHWQLAPVSMGWQGLTLPELCRTLKDPAKNGNRSPADLVKHMAEDPLVRWGWDPGGKREAVPIAHSEFVKLLEYWVTTGAECPR